MAELRNCPQCGRVFAYVGRNLCPRCMDKEEEEFKLVRSYIREHPGATIMDTSEATEVDEQKILRFLRDGRLVSRGLQASVTLECERCGQTIGEGRYCRTCLTELDRELKETVSGSSPQREAPPRDRERIHIMDNKGYKKEGR